MKHGQMTDQNKQGLAVRMGSLKDPNCGLKLFQKLLGVPPWITIGTWINDFSSIPDNLAIVIQEHEPAVFFINEIRNVN